jgi:hypothetical protein
VREPVLAPAWQGTYVGCHRTAQRVITIPPSNVSVYSSCCYLGSRVLALLLAIRVKTAGWPCFRLGGGHAVTPVRSVNALPPATATSPSKVILAYEQCHGLLERTRSL